MCTFPLPVQSVNASEIPNQSSGGATYMPPRVVRPASLTARGPPPPVEPTSVTTVARERGSRPVPWQDSAPSTAPMAPGLEPDSGGRASSLPCLREQTACHHQPEALLLHLEKWSGAGGGAREWCWGGIGWQCSQRAPSFPVPTGDYRSSIQTRSSSTQSSGPKPAVAPECGVGGGLGSVSAPGRGTPVGLAAGACAVSVPLPASFLWSRRGLLETQGPKDALVAFEQLLYINMKWPKLLDWLMWAVAQLQWHEANGDCRDKGSQNSEEEDGGKLLTVNEDYHAVLGFLMDDTEDQLQ